MVKRLLMAGVLATMQVVAARAADSSVVLRLSQSAVVAGDSVRLDVQIPDSDARVETIAVDPPQSLQPAGSSNNVSIVNGHMSQSYTRSFQFVPSQAGIVTLGPARVIYNGRVLLSNVVKLVVQASGSERQLAIDVTAEPSDLWEGQPFVLRTTVDHGAGFRPVEFVPPAADGVERFAGQSELEQRTEAVSVEGVSLSRLTMLDWRVPTGLGSLSLSGGSVRLEKTGQAHSRRLDPFAGFFNTGRSSFSQALPAVRVRVRPLPELPPGLSFAGLVGHVEVRWQSVTQGPDRTRAILNLTGTGNAGSFVLSSWVADGYRVYPDAADIKHGLTSNGQSAVVVRVPLTFVPAHEPDTARPAWFDTTTGSYRTWDLPPLMAAHAVSGPVGALPAEHPLPMPAAVSSVVAIERMPLAETLSRWLPHTRARQGATLLLTLSTMSLLVLAVAQWLRARRQGPGRALEGLALSTAVRLALAVDTRAVWSRLYRDLARSEDPRAPALSAALSSSLYAPQYVSPALAVRTIMDNHAS